MGVPTLVRCLTLYCFLFGVHAMTSPLSRHSTDSQLLPVSSSSLRNHSIPLTVNNHSLPEYVSSDLFKESLADVFYRSMQWPKFPYRYDLPHTQQTQWLQFTDSTSQRYGSVARALLLRVCDQMISWLRGQDIRAAIKGWHYVSDDVLEGSGLSHSIYFDLRPSGGHLSTRLALDATIALKGLVGRYGAFAGRFEIWQFANLRGLSEVAVIEWPPVNAVDDQ